MNKVYSEFQALPATEYKYFMIGEHKIPEFFRPYKDLPIWNPYYLVPIKNKDGSLKRMDKRPKNAQNGTNARVSHPEDWTTLEKALTYFDTHSGTKGVGMLLLDPITAIDLDHVIDEETLLIEEDANRVMDKLATYTEFSVSGTGVHCFAQMPDKPIEWAKKGEGSTLGERIELYQTVKAKEGTYEKRVVKNDGKIEEFNHGKYLNGRFYTVSFRPLEGYQFYGTQDSPDRNRSKEIQEIYKEYFPKEDKYKGTAQGYSVESLPNVSDDEVYQILFLERGKSFTDFYEKDPATDGVFNSKDDDTSGSKYDFALVHELARVSTDPEQIKRIWSESPRGDLSRKSKPQDYMDRTIKSVFDQCAADVGVLNPNYKEQTGKPGRPKKPGKPKFDLLKVGPYYREKLHAMVFDKKVLNIYDEKEGFISDPREIIRAIAQYRPDTLTNRQVKDIQEYLFQSAPGITEAPSKYIVFQNGVLNLDTKEFTERTPEIFVRNVIPWNYNPNAEPVPLVTETFMEWACNDPEQFQLMFEWMGYNLFRSYTIHAFMLLIGQKRNGKSVYCNVLRAMLGSKNTSGLAMARLDDRFQSMNLYGKLGNICDENKGAYMPESTVLKQASAGGEVDAEPKGKDSFTFRNYCKCTFCFNNDFRIDDHSGALKERTNVILFNADFSDPKKQNKSLESQLIKQGMEYIIRLSVEALYRVLEEGKFTEPEASAEWINRQDLLNNLIKQFIQDVYDGIEFLNPEPEPGEQNEQTTTENFFTSYPISTVYNVYKDWCRDNGNMAKSKNIFSSELCSVLSLESKQVKRNGKNKKYYRKIQG